MSNIGHAARTLAWPFVAVGKAYNTVAVKYPFTTGVVTTVVKTSAADIFAQKVVEKRENIDWKRHNMFCCFGLFYLGGFQYYLYNNLFSRWCATITKVAGHKGSAPVKVFIDQCIHHPVLYFPTFYALKGYVEDRPLKSTFEKYQSELWENCKALWTIWVPAQLVNFAMVPKHLRIPYVAAVSFLWTVIISVMRGALEHKHHMTDVPIDLDFAAAKEAQEHPHHAPVAQHGQQAPVQMPSPPSLLPQAAAVLLPSGPIAPIMAVSSEGLTQERT